MCRLITTLVGLAAILSAGHSVHAAATVFQKGDTLFITGTRAADSVIVIGVDGHPGIVTVQVDDEPLVAHFGLNNIAMDLQGGDNFLAVLQVHLGGELTVAAADGDNFLLLGYHTKYMPNLIWGDLSVSLGHGDNAVLLQESWLVSNGTIAAGDGNNSVVLGDADSPSDLGAVVLGDLLIETSAGDDLVEVVKCWIGGQTLIDTVDGDDTVILGTHYATGSAIAGNLLEGELLISTGQGSDGVGLTDNEIYGDASIVLEHDNDELRVGEAPGFPPNSFYADFWAHGGNGMDFLLDDPGNFYSMGSQYQGFELP
jgi:hypothetical protein